jgi:hypothetical protein
MAIKTKAIILRDDLTAKLRANYTVNEASGCWEWTGTLNGEQKYGRLEIMVTPKWYRYSAHRYSYTLAKGPIPDGLDLDHLCVNTKCVNPDHLEPVTRAENSRRVKERGRTKKHTDKPNCAHGHPFTPENTWVVPGTMYRHCKTCKRYAQRARARGLSLAEYLETNPS